ncbi:Centromere protein C [Cardamine amara subsp. amara]|uniref:Centromere protein C n=1 Tax=Cardamine amara subsp. amara TaxID=228776 RepID=A0ABD1BMT0_CARAN
MTDVSRSSSLEEDPLHAYSGLSLFPRTLKSLSNPLPPRLYQSDDLKQTHTLLESMPFEIQNEHQEQAKAILDESSELLKKGIGTSVASEVINVGVKVNPANKRERRPGLDRKRGHFSIKLTTSQPPPSEPTFDGSKYPRPEDYFAAYERFENAQREWQKQTGSSVTDTHQNPPSRRPRRPGIPGRKRGSYQHTYTDSYFTDAINLEASEKEDPIPSEQRLERTTAAQVTTADKEVNDSTVDTDKNLDNILSELLACTHDELEGDGAVNLLEDRLQIKSFNVEKLSIPEFQDVRKMDFKASGRNPSNGKSVLTDIQNMLRGNLRDALRKNSHSPSPLTKRHLSSSNPPEDQFSFPDIDNLLPGDQQSGEVDLQSLAMDLNTCSSSSVAKDADKDITNTSPSNAGPVDVARSFNSSVQKSSSEDDSDTDSGIQRFQSSLDGNADNCVDDSITNRNSATQVNVDMQTERNEGDVPISKSGANGNTGGRENDADINVETDQLERLAENASREDTRTDLFTVEKDSIPYQQGASSNRAPEQLNTMDGSFEHAEHIQGQHGEKNENVDTACELQVEKAQEVHNSSQKQTNKRRKRGSCESNMKKRSKTVHGDIGEDKQKKTLPRESGAKKQTKTKSNERGEKKQKKTVTRESKIFSRRKSLAGAGTKFESGIRRSTRIKSRPLEYWRGERFLFGRIHESLATVIGIKYGSPGDGKSQKRASKVKSFVSDEYKELVDLAALH